MNTVRWLGIALVLAGILGFLTVADDLRHTGELMGVGAVLVLGLVMVVTAWWRKAHHNGTER